MDSELRLIDMKKVSELLGCSDRHVLNMIKRGDFPEAIKVGRLSRWHGDDVRQWIDRQMKNRGNQHGCK